MSQNDASGWPDDQTLMAFADGQLPPDQAEQIAHFLEENSEARDFVERLKVSGALAHRAYDDVKPAPANDRLEALLLGDGVKTSAAAAEASENVVSFPGHSPRESPASRYILPLAASIALIVGAVSGFLAGRPGPAGEARSTFDIAIGPVGKGTPVSTLLELRPSGVQMPVAGGQSLMVISTFRDRDDKPCREIEISANDATRAPAVGAVACRQADGQWFVEGAARMPSSDGAYNPASGGDTPAMQGILTAIGAKPALPKSAEDALLKNGWK